MTARFRCAVAVATAALFVASCTSNAPVATQSPSKTPDAARTASPTPAPPPAFDAAHVIAHDRMLSQTIGAREAASEAYERAADYVANVFAGYGYRVVRQPVSVPAGTTEKVPVPAGTSQNVIAYPRAYDPAEPHLVAGAHLDSVPVSPGANDNGSGVATILELSLLAARVKTALPVVFVAFTGEERRFKGSEGALFGSRHYVKTLAASERASIAGMMNVDMIANGPVTLVCRRSAKSSRRMLDATLQRAHALGAPARENLVTKFFSDHLPFEDAGIPVAWLWSGEHPTVHTPRDTMSVVRKSDLDRSGRVAWETLRTFS